MPVTWFGAEIAARITEAAVEAVDDTTAAAVQESQSEHWWRSHASRNLERQTVSDSATLDGTAVVGRFGTTQRRGFYGLFLELEEPFLRPVADRVFPELPVRLREKLER